MLGLSLRVFREFRGARLSPYFASLPPPSSRGSSLSQFFQARQKNNAMVWTDIEDLPVRVACAQSPQQGISRWSAMQFGQQQTSVALSAYAENKAPALDRIDRAQYRRAIPQPRWSDRRRSHYPGRLQRTALPDASSKASPRSCLWLRSSLSRRRRPSLCWLQNRRGSSFGRLPNPGTPGPGYPAPGVPNDTALLSPGRKCTHKRRWRLSPGRMSVHAISISSS